MAPGGARAPVDQRAHPLPAPESPSVHRSPQIPAAARMLGIKSSTCVQVALVEFPRAGRGRWARGGTPTAIGIGGINSSASVQVAPVVILAAHLGVGRADVPGHRDHSNRQRGQESEDSKAHDWLSMCRGAARSNLRNRPGFSKARRPPTVRSCRIAASFRFSAMGSSAAMRSSTTKPTTRSPLEMIHAPLIGASPRDRLA